jgi:hypothetical protein
MRSWLFLSGGIYRSQADVGEPGRMKSANSFYAFVAVWDTWMVASGFSSQWNDEQGVLLS